MGFYQEAARIPGIRLFEQMDLSACTSLNVGGAARFFAEVDTKKSLCDILKVASDNGLSPYVIGSGTNLLVSDRGYTGLIIRLSGEFMKFSWVDNRVFSGAAVKLVSLLNFTRAQGLSGLEFAAGIPGTIGGGIKGNAGASGQSVGDLVHSLEIMTFEGVRMNLNRKDIEFSYRRSSLSKDRIVLSCLLDLKNADIDDITRRINRNILQRMRSQPHSVHSCGCIFKNPCGDSAGKIIDRLGMRGMKRGGAVVSEKHANFILNTGSASAEDIAILIREIRDRVHNENGINLELEIELLGDFEL